MKKTKNMKMLVLVFCMVLFVFSAGSFASADNLSSPNREYDLSWFDKTPPPLQVPTENVVYVSTVSELQHAAATAEPYTTIIIAEGTYQLNFTILLDKEGMTLMGATPNREDVVLLGNGFRGERGRDPRTALQIYSPNVTVANLTIKDFSLQGIAVQGWEDPTPHNVHIYNVGFIDIGQHNFKVNKKDDRPHPENGIIEYCYFNQIQDIDPNRNDSTGVGNYVGAIDAHKIKNWIIRDNIILNNRGGSGGGDGGIFVWMDSIGTIIERNLLIGNNKGISIGNWHLANEENFWHHTGGVVRNNFIVLNQPQGYVVGMEIAKVNGLKVYNNTIAHFDANYFRGIRYLHEDNVLEIKNNIVRGKLSDEGSAELKDNATSVPDTWFRDFANGDLRLTKEGFQAIRSLLDDDEPDFVPPEVTDDFFGNARKGRHEIGAHQLTGYPRDW